MTLFAPAFAKPMKIRARLFLFDKPIKCFAFLFMFCFYVCFSRSYESRSIVNRGQKIVHGHGQVDIKRRGCHCS